MSTAPHAFRGVRAQGVLTRARGLSIEQLMLVAGLVAAGGGALSLAQGVYGGTRGAELRGAVVSAGRFALLLGLTSTAVSIAIARWRHGRFWPPRVDHSLDSVLPRALLWSVIGWLALMTYPATVALSRNPFRQVTWLAWGLQDNRWLIATYLITIFSAVALPPLAARWLDDRAHVRPAPAPPSGGWTGRTVIPLLVGVVFALVLFAPPWNLEFGSGEVGNHDVHLSQLQAIRSGAVPYIGPASIQYGPGSQLLQYAYMSRIGEFSLLGYRESYAALLLVGFAIFAATSVGVLGLRQGTLASLLALYVSPFVLFTWNGPVLTSFFGWANPFRYLGAFVVVGLLPAVLTRTRGWRNTPALLVGVAWGVFTWISQENLATSGLAAGLFLVTAWALGAYTLPQIRGAVFNGLAGWIAVWAPILGDYAAKGELRRFVEGYFLISRFVAAGMSNTPWDLAINRGWNMAFYLTPVVLLAAAWMTIVDWSSRRLPVPLPPERQRLLAFVCVALVCFTGALLRKDSSHFINVLIALPAVIAGIAVQAARRPGPLWLRSLVLAGLVAFVAQFPVAARLLRFPAEYVIQPWARFELARHMPPSAWEHEPGVAFSRAGAFVRAEYPIYENAMPARQFLHAMEEVRRLVGDRPAFVHSFPQVPPELVYFFADLTPGPILFNISTMVFHTGIQERFLRHMGVHCREFGAVIGTDAMSPEVAMFKRCHPASIEIAKTIAGKSYFIWLNGPE